MCNEFNSGLFHELYLAEHIAGKVNWHIFKNKRNYVKKGNPGIDAGEEQMCCEDSAVCLLHRVGVLSGG